MNIPSQYPSKNRPIVLRYADILLKPGISRRDCFFALKRMALSQDRCLQDTRQKIKRHQKYLSNRQAATPAYKLATAKYANAVENGLKACESLLEASRKAYQHSTALLFELMRDDSLAPTWHDVAQFLGISHVAMENFLAENRRHAEWCDILAKPSLLKAAFNHAEVCGEPDRGFIYATESRPIVLFRVASKGIINAIQANPVMKYRTDKHLSELFGGAFPAPEPVRHFSVVQP